MGGYPEEEVGSNSLGALRGPFSATVMSLVASLALLTPVVQAMLLPSPALGGELPSSPPMYPTRLPPMPVADFKRSNVPASEIQDRPLIQFQKSDHVLFRNFSTLNVRMRGPFDQLFAGKEIRNKEMPVLPGFIQIDGEREIPVQLQVRGHSTRILCPFPKLKLIFGDPSATMGTSFEGIRQLDLGTHCVDDPEASSVKKMAFKVGANKFNHRQAVILRWAELLGLPVTSFRPVFIQYKNTDSLFGGRFSPPEQALLIEDFRDTAKRANAIVRKITRQYEGGSPSIPDWDLTYLHFTERFNDFIGNRDWSASISFPQAHNVKALELPDRRLIAVPHDFDLSEVSLGVASRRPGLWEKSLGPDLYLSERRRAEIRDVFLASESEMISAVDLLRDSDPVGHKNIRANLLALMGLIRKCPATKSDGPWQCP